MITLAFYKGRAASPWHRLQDRVIRLATRGKYSHVEFIVGDAEFGVEVACLSSSARDGGVRVRSMALRPENWDLVTMAIDHRMPEIFIRARVGAKYDYLGVMLSHVLALGEHDGTRWFCSEIIGAALGLPEPQRLSPQLLFDVVTWRGGVKGVKN